MRAIVTIQSGTQAGRKLWLKTGQSMRIGRTELADFSIPDDARMSSLHFELECGSQSVRLRDLNSANGTTVNGRGVAEATLHDGDEIVAGSTTFGVSLEDSLRQSVARSPLPSTAFRADETFAGDVGRVPIRETGECDNRSAEMAAAETADGWQITMSGQNRRFVVRWMEHVTVGRAPTADISVPDDLQMSGLHFGLSASGADLRIEDLSSTNGTFVNGQRVRSAGLNNGDVITAGATRLVVHAPQVARRAAPPAVPEAGAAAIDIRGTVACPEDQSYDSPVTPSVPDRPTPPPPLHEELEPSTLAADIDTRPPADRSLPAATAGSGGHDAARDDIEIVIVDLSRSGRSLKKFWLTPGQQVVVGSSAGCDEVIENDSGLAARHFLLQLDPTECVVRDLQSPGGTYVNEQKAVTATLKNGDIVRAGDCTFHLQIVHVAKPS